MKEVKLVQISDLHLGDDFVLRSILRRRFWWKNDNEKLLRGLEDAIRSIKPNYVLITGDIVNKCTGRTLMTAAERLRSLLAGAGIDIKQQVLIIPGNHDVKVFATEDEIFGRLREFVHFLKVFFDEQSYRTRTERFIRVDPIAKVCFFCLDSTLKENQPIADGKVGEPQWRWLEKKYGDLQQGYTDFDRYIKIVALHHHPYAIEGSGSDRGMQLDDAGRARAMFERIGANIVIHGHKHYPHYLVHRYDYQDRKGQYTVIGAGTSTCPFPEEQAGEGNSFNLLTLRPAVNQLEVIRYKANNEGQFRPSSNEPLVLELFRASAVGYRSQEFSLEVRVLDTDGTCTLTYRRVGLYVDSPEANEVRKMLFFMGGLPPAAEIKEFSYTPRLVEKVEYEVDELREKRGFLVLARPLQWGTEPVDLWSTYRITKAVRFTADSSTRTEPTEESVDMEVVHPCDQLTLTLELPHGLRVKPEPRILDRNSVPRTVPVVFEADPVANRYTLRVRRPQDNWTYGLYWPLDIS